MSAVSSIEWTDRTWNPVRGCSIVSPGCINCYAMKQAHRFSGPGRPYEGLTKLTERSGPQWTGVVRTVEDALLEPLSWRTPSRVFVNSMSDLFHEDVPDAFIDQVFAVMALAPQHTFQVLTKRAERMLDYLSQRREPDDALRIGIRWSRAVVALTRGLGSAGRRWSERAWDDHLDWAAESTWRNESGVLPNVWLGVSAEDQQRADERIPALLETPAAVRFVSAEPLLGPIDFTLRGDRVEGWDEDWRYDVLSGEEWAGPRADAVDRSQHVDWVIVGGESGPGARSFDPEWARSIVTQCVAADVPVFVKQLGSRWAAEYGRRQRTYMPNGSYVRHLSNQKGGDPAEWPEDLRVRQFPEGRTA